MLFSERQGIVTPKTAIQVDAFDKETRIRIWNLIVSFEEVLLSNFPYEYWSNRETVYKEVWIYFFVNDIDAFRIDSARKESKQLVYSGEWHSVLDFAEFYARRASIFDYNAPEGFRSSINKLFESFLVGYRFIDGEIVPVSAAIEVSEIEGALESAHPTAKVHLQ
ncbi:MAG: hypothetical protein WBA28_00445, partial [Microbacteriaceae bacterium]